MEAPPVDNDDDREAFLPCCEAVISERKPNEGEVIDAIYPTSELLAQARIRNRDVEDIYTGPPFCERAESGLRVMAAHNFCSMSASLG